MLGIVTAGLMILVEDDLITKNYLRVTEKDTNNILMMPSIFALEKLGLNGGYIVEVSIHEKSILRENPGKYDSMYNYKPFGSTIGFWILNRKDCGETYYDLIQTDNKYEFVQGFKTLCEIYGLNYRDYIYGQPITEEGMPWENYVMIIIKILN